MSKEDAPALINYMLVEREQLVETITRLVILIKTKPASDVNEHRDRQDQLLYMKGYQKMLEGRIQRAGVQT